MDIALTISNRQISPQVVNMFQFENGTTTLNFTLDSYMYGEVNLRNYKAYAITSINGNIDMTELVMNYDASKDKLTLSWNVKEFTLLEAGAVLYQIVFKEATASGIPEEGENTAVFYSYKAILINRESIDGDNEISAKYPTLLKQWLDRMNAMAEMQGASIIYMKYGEPILPADRLAGQLYFQYTDTLNTKGQFEDDRGNVLSDPDVVHLFGNETIGGQKTFTTSPKVPTPATDSNDTTVANTAFIKNAVKGALTNTATMSGALTILGTASNWSKSVNVGSNSSVAGVEGTAVGSSADAANSGAALGYGANSTGIASTALGAGTTASAVRAIAIGSTAQATAEGAIQIGSGTNSTSNTLQVGGYTLLNTSTGLIPADRISDLSSKYLAKSGGTMTGDIIGDRVEFTILQKNDANSTIVRGGTAYASGASLVLFGKDNENAGIARIIAHDGVNINNFLLYPNGTATVGGKNVITSAGGQMDGPFRASAEGFVTGVADDNSVRMSGGTGWDNGASVVVYGKDHASHPGRFRIKAENGTNEAVFQGDPAGDLTWNGKPIVVLVDEQKPTSSNNYTWYRKYSDGWVEQGGRFPNASGTAQIQLAATMPVAITGGTLQVLPEYVSGDSVVVVTAYYSGTTVNATLEHRTGTKSTTASGRWLLCGYEA